VGGAFRIIGSENAGLYFRHSDHLGGTSVLSDADGLRVEGSEAAYAPFGEVRLQRSGQRLICATRPGAIASKCPP